ncbi:beta strand repeat-containing protein, partial [Faecalibacterium wellingii]
AALAAAPAAPTAPAEDDTVATINGQGYKSFDEAVKAAQSGDIIKVTKDTETDGMNISKKLTIQGVTTTTTKTKDDGTVEETTVKPKLTFKKDGIALWGTDLTFKDMQVEMKGVGSTPYTAEWNWMTISASKNATLTLDNTVMTMDGTGTADNTHAIYFGSNNKLNVQNGSNLTIQNYKQDALEWDGGDGGYNCNITGGSTFTSDNNRSGFTGTFYVTVDDSDVKVINSTGSGSNGSYFTIQNDSNVLFDNNSYWGISAWRIDMSDDSTLTATNNGYSGVWTRVLNVDKTCTLDVESNGKKAGSAATNPGIFFQGNGKIKSTIEEGAKVTIKDNAGSGIYTKQTVCDLTIGSATITNNGSGSVNEKGIGAENGGGIYNIGTLKLGKGVTITGNTAKNGGGVYTKSVKTKGGKVTIDNSTITENKATGNGGGICAEDNSTVTVVGGEISSNTSTGVEQTISGGGGLYTNNSTVTLDKVTITGNKAINAPSNDGGGILAAGSDLTITGSTITENTAPDCGGGLFLSHTNANITGSTIEGNQSKHGAGVYLNDSSDVAEADCTGSHTHNITDTKINHNTASSIGGGMYVGTKSNVTLTGSTLDGNVSTDKTNGQGGAIVAYGAGDITLDSTTITNNDAAVGGGLFSLGVAASDTHITLRNNTKFIGNTAASGAGIYLMRSSGNNILLELTDSAIDNNTASNLGGGIFAYDGAQINANKASFNGNKAANGAGMYLYGLNNKVMAELTDSFIDNNIASDWGGGIFAYNGAEVKANNTSISNNKGGNAGGLLVWNNSSAELSNGSKVCGNTATNGNGGGVYAINGTVTATDCDISDNDAGQYNGGGICAQNSALTLEKNTLNRNKSKSGGAIWMNASDAELSGNTITHNTATGNGGGIYSEQRSTIDLRTGALYNNHAGTAGDDMYLNNTTLILRPVGDDWILDDCGHPIDGWYLDGKDARWDADSQKKFVTNLDALLEGTDYMIEKGEDGCYIITIDSNALALKAAHNAPSEPKPDPDGPDTPNPNPNPKPEPKPGPDTSITPEDPQLPPVQDARADTPDSPVLPANTTNPAVQDAHALPQTGTSLFAALAMALSGFALTIAGAWASLLGKNSRH